MSVQAETVTAPTMPEMVAGATSGINRMGNQAATTNVSGLTTQLAGLFALLDSQGVFAQNPQLRAQFDALQSSIDKGTKGKTKKLTQAELRLTDAQSQKTDIESKLASGSLTDKERQKLQKQLTKVDANITKFQETSSKLSTEINNQYGRLDAWKEGNLEGARTGADMLREQFPELQRTLDEAAPYLDRMGQPGATGERLLEALGQGYTANTIGSRDVRAAQMGPVADVRAQQIGASRMGDFGRANATTISAGQVGQGTLGASLMNRAQAGIDRAGQLSPEAARDAVQAARQGFAARGLATGNAALGAELLNRDRYSRQREFEDLGFAQQVQGQDLGRQFQNVGNQLTAAQSNQSAALQAEVANLQARYNAAAQNGNWQQAAAIQNQMATLQADTANQQTAFNTGQFNTSQQNVVGMSNADRALNASIANEEARRLGNQQNIGMLGQAFTTDRMINQEGLGAALQRGQLESAANPANMMLGMYSAGQPTGTQALGPATSLANTWATNALNASMFNANSNMWANAANQYGNYGGQSGQGSLWGGLGGAALGAGAGALIAGLMPGGMGATTGALVGAGLGGGVGSGVGGLFAR